MKYLVKYLSADEIKAEELEMLLKFDTFCESEGLRYSLAGGTLLGAVRHKGFIPWDDDIDVSMPRPDFNKLVSLGRAGKLPKGHSLEPYSGDWDHPVFLKFLYDCIRVDAHYENGIGRLWMDITPVDGLSADDDENNKLFSEAKRLQRTLMFCKADPHKGKTAAKRLLKRFLVPVLNNLGIYRRSIERLDNLGSGCAFGSTSWVGCVVWGLYGPGERYPAEGWDDMVRLDFEGRELSAIGCWDAYLTGLYGDYMQLPPEEKRVTHDIKAWRVDGC